MNTLNHSTENTSAELLNDSYSVYARYPQNPITPGILEAYNYFLYAIIAFGVLGNIFVLLVFIFNRPTKTTDWFILFITTCDFLSSMFNVPVYVTFTNTMWRYYGTNFICRFHMFFSQSIVLSSAFLIAALAMDRYVKVCRPNSTLLTCARARNACLLITVCTVLLSCPCFIMYRNLNSRCTPVADGQQLIAYYLMVFVIFCVSTGIVLIAYAKVTKVIRQSEININRHQIFPQRMRSGNTSFLCKCWLFKRDNDNRIAPSSTENFTLNDHSSTIERTSHLLQVPSRRKVFPISDSSTGEPIHVSVISSTSSSVDVSKMSSNLLSGNRQNLRKTIRITKISFLICLVFVISWIPPWLSFISTFFPSLVTSPVAIRCRLFGRMTYLLNTVLNPFVYAVINKRFRLQLKRIFIKT